MTRRALSTLALAVAAVVLALLGAFLFSGRANAFGPDHGHGMMGGSGYHSGYGMTGRAASSASLLIRHQRAHCHAWSLNGGPFKAAQQVTLDEGSSLTIINNDVMPHRLVKLAGNTVTMRNGTVMPMMGGGYVSQTPGLMSHMGARTTVTFPKTGVYRFRTKAGEDYMSGIRTTGDDNVLALTVTVR